jgi:hypothetical protein
MGVRLHTEQKHEIVYSNTAGFNYSSDYINPILLVLSEYDLWYDNDTLEGATKLECERDILIENIEHIITPNDKWGYQEDLNEEIENMEKHTDITRETLYKTLVKLIDESDERNSRIYFSWH